MKFAESFVPDSSQLEQLHRRDWPIGGNGGFQKVVFTLDMGSARHQYALRLAERLAGATLWIDAIYFRGSGMEIGHTELVRDLDLIVVASDRSSAQSHVKETIREFRRENPFDLRVDVSVIGTLSALSLPPTSVKQLILAFRALLVAGRDIWPESPFVRPDVDLARACFSAHAEPTWQWLATVAQDPARHFQDSLVSWVQKRALRAGGILAMASLGRFSRHPLRCAELIGLMFSELSDLASKVAQDYCVGRSQAAAWHDALALLDALSLKATSLLFARG